MLFTVAVSADPTICGCHLRHVLGTVGSWPIPDSDQVSTYFIKTAASLMVRNVTVGVKVTF